MKKKVTTPFVIEGIAALHSLLGLPKPLHPLVSIIDLSKITCLDNEVITSLCYSFYSVCTKHNFNGRMKYGQNYYDFDNGIMTFFSPGQVISTEGSDIACAGMWLVFDPDFIRNSALGKAIKDYGYFSYAVNEALHLQKQKSI